MDETPREMLKRIRKRLRYSQDSFAYLFGISVGTLRGWECGKCRPNGTALVLLKLIDRDPVMVLRAINPQMIGQTP